ncbi:MAG: DUF427 domain-containing protein [Bacteroidetes bacterium]|jgi:uncharacterized protein (DUF427 family)|nr:DUF427 domain-containing protein [Bacteroidota bacterium]
MRLINPNDPNHYAIYRKSAQHLRIRVEDMLLAETYAPIILNEKGRSLYDTVYYIPKKDVYVRMHEKPNGRTQCPIKGTAYTWAWSGITDLAWSYEEPHSQAKVLKDYIAFNLNVSDMILLCA